MNVVERTTHLALPGTSLDIEQYHQNWGCWRMLPVAVHTGNYLRFEDGVSTYEFGIENMTEPRGEGYDGAQTFIMIDDNHSDILKVDASISQY